ncbi:MAG: hypothetical protein KJ995_06570 [Candidatus Omnitrophica bacterium]|nr:hypothetical protein [Candidatus Omnitrophota bacterium]MBU1128463.1 hypothetical protein [Candidatus Omnitrophota bacterium]MBU1656639.1 hypothetical protein [Candidatus Omnitrophota bacterium]MBU1784940.1 hypothetical protein [Candidatus Omnitrophota bacterium]MBU1852047.1 hypothetical protein [Candidatus Omnitrophota bacterium]
MLEREAKYYTAGDKGNDPLKAPLYLRSLIFDGPEGDFNAELIDLFNVFLQKKKNFSKFYLKPFTAHSLFPKKIVVINASHDDLPTSYETARVFEKFLFEKKCKIDICVVNTREELMGEVAREPGKTLVVSQCVDKKVYNVGVAEDFESMGVVIVPGKMTAPGSVFSDKDSTYRLLSAGGKRWDSVARYRKVSDEGGDIENIGRDIIDAIDDLAVETGDDVFFVKPHEGGGGLGGFRISKKGDEYMIPDLSKVSGDDSVIHPTFIDIDVNDTAKLRELLWIYRLFSTDEKMKTNYLLTRLPLKNAGKKEALQILKEYLKSCEEKKERKLEAMRLSRVAAEAKLTAAIKIFEKKFKRRYVALVNEHIDFGTWGLRAHYRLSEKGPKLEAMYSRIFQLAFTKEGIGYLGSDNISNKQTGELEILRLGPINAIMLEAIGGKEALFKTLLEGARALASLAELIPGEEREHVPLRAQFDLAAISQRIGEGNADTARGLCLASRWGKFIENNREWLNDSLAYYSWKKYSER